MHGRHGNPERRTHLRRWVDIHTRAEKGLGGLDVPGIRGVVQRLAAILHGTSEAGQVREDGGDTDGPWVDARNPSQRPPPRAATYPVRCRRNPAGGHERIDHRAVPSPRRVMHGSPRLLQ